MLDNKKNIQKIGCILQKLIFRMLTWIRVILNKPVNYQLEHFSILLPPDHKLPVHQKSHPKYDKFLPKLVKYIENSSTVIDVGANVGDSLAGMIESNKSLKYVCIEADELFYSFLQKNIQKMRDDKTSLDVISIKNLIGKKVSGITLEGKGGTKRAVEGKNGKLNSISLDQLMKSFPHSKIRLIKIDVDGFDYDVLDSASFILKRDAPILFFELQQDFLNQKIGYMKTIKFLESIGYNEWVVFDNFGEIILRTSKIDIIFQLMNYVWKQNVGDSTRTIFYFDILAAQQNDLNLLDRAISEYQ